MSVLTSDILPSNLDNEYTKVELDESLFTPTQTPTYYILDHKPKGDIASSYSSSPYISKHSSDVAVAHSSSPYYSKLASDAVSIPHSKYSHSRKKMNINSPSPPSMATTASPYTSFIPLTASPKSISHGGSSTTTTMNNSSYNSPIFQQSPIKGSLSKAFNSIFENSTTNPRSIATSSPSSSSSRNSYSSSPYCTSFTKHSTIIRHNSSSKSGSTPSPTTTTTTITFSPQKSRLSSDIITFTKTKVEIPVKVLKATQQKSAITSALSSKGLGVATTTHEEKEKKEQEIKNNDKISNTIEKTPTPTPTTTTAEAMPLLATPQKSENSKEISNENTIKTLLKEETPSTKIIESSKNEEEKIEKENKKDEIKRDIKDEKNKNVKVVLTKEDNSSKIESHESTNILTTEIETSTLKTKDTLASPLTPTTEASTEETTETSIERTTEKITETSIEMSTEKTTEKTTKASTEISTETSTETSIEKTTTTTTTTTEIKTQTENENTVLTKSKASKKDKVALENSNSGIEKKNKRRKSVNFNSDTFKFICVFSSCDAPKDIKNSKVEVETDEPVLENEDKDYSELRNFNTAWSSVPRNVIHIQKFKSSKAKHNNCELPVKIQSFKLVSGDPSETEDIYSCLKIDLDVQNLNFHKKVIVRFTTDNWKSYSEVEAVYHKCIREGSSVKDEEKYNVQHVVGLDRFTARIDAKKYFVLEEKPGHFCNLRPKKMLLVARYEVNNKTYWDNNDFSDYQVELVRINAGYDVPRVTKHGKPIPCPGCHLSAKQRQMNEKTRNEVKECKRAVRKIGGVFGNFTDAVTPQTVNNQDFVVDSHSNFNNKTQQSSSDNDKNMNSKDNCHDSQCINVETKSSSSSSSLDTTINTNSNESMDKKVNNTNLTESKDMAATFSSSSSSTPSTSTTTKINSNESSSIITTIESNLENTNININTNTETNISTTTSTTTTTTNSTTPTTITKKASLISAKLKGIKNVSNEKDSFSNSLNKSYSPMSIPVNEKSHSNMSMMNIIPKHQNTNINEKIPSFSPSQAFQYSSGSGSPMFSTFSSSSSSSISKYGPPTSNTPPTYTSRYDPPTSNTPPTFASRYDPPTSNTPPTYSSRYNPPTSNTPPTYASRYDPPTSNTPPTYASRYDPPTSNTPPNYYPSRYNPPTSNSPLSTSSANNVYSTSFYYSNSSSTTSSFNNNYSLFQSSPTSSPSSPSFPSSSLKYGFSSSYAFSTPTPTPSSKAMKPQQYQRSKYDIPISSNYSPFLSSFSSSKSLFGGNATTTTSTA